MRHHRELFDSVRRRTSMHFAEDSYRVVEAFVYGYDAACEGGLLAGFKEWLVMRVGSGSNLAWSGLVLYVAFPDAKSPLDALGAAGQEGERHAIDTLFQLIEEFDQVRSKRDGLKQIFIDYERWERDRDAELDKQLSRDKRRRSPR